MNIFSTCALEDKFQRVTRKNTVGSTNVLTISAQHGLINQFEYYNNQYASENTSGYTLLHKGDFAYNKSYSEGYPFGATKKLERYESGIVSPLYICFAAKAGVCDDFYSYYFESEPFYREIYKIAQEGARNHGLLNVPAEDFFQIKIADPPLAEQKRIAEILGCCDRVIALKKELIAEKKKQKKALMQKLLNPDSGFRLPGFTGEWRRCLISEICTIESGGTPATSNEKYWGGDIFWCTPSDISNSGKYITFTPQTISQEGIKNSSAALLPVGSIIMCSRASIGPRCITKVPMTTNQGFKNFICSNLLYNEFWYYFIDTILEDLYKMASGNTFKEISKSSIETYHVVIPASYKEQQAIADILSAADKEIVLLEQELEQQQQKKKTLMQLLLTGIVRA
ncbi:MAG: hypothetical protein E7055_06950 [Lentisphaerae bacterium]|nr:hypothetical protein [Lentisphaerota bacterium]